MQKNAVTQLMSDFASRRNAVPQDQGLLEVIRDVRFILVSKYTLIFPRSALFVSLSFEPPKEELVLAKLNPDLEGVLLWCRQQIVQDLGKTMEPSQRRRLKKTLNEVTHTLAIVAVRGVGKSTGNKQIPVWSFNYQEHHEIPRRFQTPYQVESILKGLA